MVFGKIEKKYHGLSCRQLRRLHFEKNPENR